MAVFKGYDKFLKKIQALKRIDDELKFDNLEFRRRVIRNFFDATTFPDAVLVKVERDGSKKISYPWNPYGRETITYFGQTFSIRPYRVDELMSFKHRFISGKDVDPEYDLDPFIGTNPAREQRLGGELGVPRKQRKSRFSQSIDVWVEFTAEGVALMIEPNTQIPLFDFWKWILEDFK